MVSIKREVTYKKAEEDHNMSGKPNKYSGTRTEKNLEAAFAGESEAPKVCPICGAAQASFEINQVNY